MNCVESRYGSRKSRADSAPSTCITIETISAPTTAAAELRVTVDSSTAIEAIASTGIRYATVAMPISVIPRPVLTRVPDSSVTGSKPHARPPRMSPDPTNRMSASAAYVNAASVLPANTCQRSTERVRMVFSVPFWSSVATMSPATSDVTSGISQIEPNARHTSGMARPVSRT